MPRLLSGIAWILASVLMLGMALGVQERGASPDKLLPPLEKRLVLPSMDAVLTDPAQRVMAAELLTLNPNVPAPAFVTLGSSPGATIGGDITDPTPNPVFGPVVFNFTVSSNTLQVNCMVYLNNDLIAFTTLNQTNSPYQLHVQADQDYARGPITTTIVPSDQISSINGAIHYFASGTDQYYEGLLFYWQTAGP